MWDYIRFFSECPKFDILRSSDEILYWPYQLRQEHRGWHFQLERSLVWMDGCIHCWKWAKMSVIATSFWLKGLMAVRQIVLCFLGWLIWREFFSVNTFILHCVKEAGQLIRINYKVNNEPKALANDMSVSHNWICVHCFAAHNRDEYWKTLLHESGF